MSTIDAKLPSAPDVPGPPPRILIVRAPYYAEVVDGLRDGAVRILTEAGASFEILDVAGALELAGAVRLAVDAGGYDGFVTLGCVVKGETDHYEFICREAMAGVTYVTLHYGLCLGHGLLTVHDVSQALDRSGPDGHNKGAEAAAAALLQIRAARWLNGARA